jgi:hypothetical protein
MDLQPVACRSGMCETGPPQTLFTGIFPHFKAANPGLQPTPDFALIRMFRQKTYVPENIPVRAYQCLDWGVSRSRLFRVWTGRRCEKLNE